MDAAELRKHLDLLTGTIERTLEYAKAISEALEATSQDSPLGPVVAVDDIPVGARAYIHFTDHGTYIGRRPKLEAQPLQAPSIWDQSPDSALTHFFSPIHETTTATAAHNFGLLGYRARGYRTSDGVEVHSDTCGRANGQCDCGAQRDTDDPDGT